MGYRSNVFLKTTTEGWLLMKRFDDTIEKWEHKPLCCAEVYNTSTGYYKIEFIDVKWYDSYESVINFNKVLKQFDELDIPYSFVRLGEETEDIEHRRNYPDDMPYEIESFEPVVDVNDEDAGTYETCEDHTREPMPTDTTEITFGDKAFTEAMDDHLRPIMFETFDTYKYDEDIMAHLRSLEAAKEITAKECARAIEKYNDWLAEWSADQEV